MLGHRRAGFEVRFDAFGSGGLCARLCEVSLGALGTNLCGGRFFFGFVYLLLDICQLRAEVRELVVDLASGGDGFGS